jgi:hypothetical protein
MMVYLKYSSFAFLFLLFFSCSSSEVENTIENQEVVANQLLSIELEGMVCQMGCGGSIRKELKETGAVVNCDFDFEDEREINSAKISFDKDKISAQEIINIISSMNDNQFTIVSSSSKDVQIQSVNPDEEKSNSKQESKVKITEPTFEFPNLLKLFSRIIS